MGLAEHYDAVAREQTRFYQQASLPMRILLHRPVERQINREVGSALAGVESVADAGCGFGRYLLDGLSDARRVLLADLSPTMLRSLAAALGEQYPQLEISTREGDIASLGADGCHHSELLLSIGVINHLRPDELLRALDGFAAIAERTILLYYAHERFALARRVGGSYHAQGLFYRAHERATIVDRLARHGFRLADSSYLYRLPLISPLVMQTFRREEDR